LLKRIRKFVKGGWKDDHCLKRGGRGGVEQHRILSPKEREVAMNGAESRGRGPGTLALGEKKRKPAA